MENKSAHIFDIDNTLWNIKRQVWIIDKTRPQIPLMKLDESDFAMVKSGVYRSHDNMIRYSGSEYFLPDDLMEELKVRIKKERSDISNIGFSLQEYLDKDIIDELEFDILYGNITHIKNKVDDIYVISSSIIKDKYTKMSKKLDEKMTEMGLNIEEYYFTSRTYNNQVDDENIFTKGIVILKHLIGLNIKDSKFINEECNKYNKVSYYDSNDYNIIRLGELQSQFEHLYHNSEDYIQKLILERLSDNLEIILNVVSTNELNRFIKTGLVLSKPRKLMMYESFMVRRKN